MTVKECGWCGRPTLPNWVALDEVWLAFAGDRRGDVACQECFYAWAAANNLDGYFLYMVRVADAAPLIAQTWGGAASMSSRASCG